MGTLDTPFEECGGKRGRCILYTRTFSGSFYHLHFGKTRRMMLREVKWFTGGHTAGTMQSQCWNSVLTAGTHLLTTVLNTSLCPMRLFQSTVKRVLRDQWVPQLMWFLKSFCKLQSAKQIEEVLLVIKLYLVCSKLPYDMTASLRTKSSAFPFFPLGPCCGCPTHAHRTAHLNLSALWNQRSHN